MRSEGRRLLALRRAPERKPRKDWVDRVEDSKVARLLAVLAPASIVLTLIALTLNTVSQSVSRSVAAWNTVLNRDAPGPAKKEALEYLNRPRFLGLVGPPQTSLEGVDLGASEGQRPAFLTGINLSRADLRQARFDGPWLDHANFSRAELSRVSFQNVRARSVNFRQSRMMLTSFRRSVFNDSNFDGARISPGGSDDPFIAIGGSFQNARLFSSSGETGDFLLFGSNVANARLNGVGFRGVAWRRRSESPPITEFAEPGLKIFVCAETPPNRMQLWPSEGFEN